jgi:hypothetical protein
MFEWEKKPIISITRIQSLLICQLLAVRISMKHSLFWKRELGTMTSWLTEGVNNFPLLYFLMVILSRGSKVSDTAVGNQQQVASSS